MFGNFTAQDLNHYFSLKGVKDDGVEVFFCLLIRIMCDTSCYSCSSLG